ncbi:MAG: hypothetical protein H7834_14530, partial [Magnetococcus sp. YQC-9]
MSEEQIKLRWLMMSAVQHLHAERFQAALADCESALRLDPENNSRLYLLRATLFARMHRFTDAIANLNEAIDIQREYGIAYLMRAYCHRAIGNSAAADQDLQKALMMAEAILHGFCAETGMIRTRFDATQALFDGDRDYPQLFLPAEEIERLRQAA